MTTLIIIIAVVLSILIMAYLLLQLWFKKIEMTHSKVVEKLIIENELSELKIDLEDQFDFLDLSLSENKLRKKYGIHENRIPIESFITVTPEQYASHLEYHLPPSKRDYDVNSYSIYSKTDSGYVDVHYLKGTEYDKTEYNSLHEFLLNEANIRLKQK